LSPPSPADNDEEEYPPLYGPCITLAQLKKKKPSFACKPYLPFGTVVALVGPPETGKTTFAAAVAADLTGGPRLSSGAKRCTGSFLWFSGEEDLASMVEPKLNAAGVNPKLLHFRGYSTDGRLIDRLTLPSGLSELEGIIRRDGVKGVFFDPVQSFLAEGMDANNAQDARRVMEGLNDVANATGALIMVTLHHRKSKNGSPLEWVAGSGAWTQVARVVLQLAKDDDKKDGFLMLVPKYSVGRKPKGREFELENVDGTPVFRLRHETERLPEDMTGDALNSSRRAERLTGDEWMRQELEDGPTESVPLLDRWKGEGYTRDAWWETRERLRVQHDSMKVTGKRTFYLFLPQHKAKMNALKRQRPN
jgi:hypothetical protein